MIAPNKSGTVDPYMFSAIGGITTKASFTYGLCPMPPTSIARFQKTNTL